MFEAHFSLSSTILIKNVKEYKYFLLIHDEASMTRCEIMKIIYKISSNKTIKINKIINKTLQQFARVIIK